MYITYNDVISRYSALRSLSANSPELNTDIAYAEQEVNGRFASHFSTPFSGAHPTIKDICIDLCYYRNIRIKDPDLAEKFKDSIIGRIEDIKAGKEYIMTDSNTSIAANANQSNEIWSTTMDYEPTFSMLNADNSYSHVDSQRIYDEEQARS